MKQFSVLITRTDRSRNQDGTFRTMDSLVTVLAHDSRDATLVANQMVAARTHHLDHMVLGHRVL